MSHLTISKKNEVSLQVKADPHVYYELADQFTFEVQVQNLCPSTVTSIGMEKYAYSTPRMERYTLGC